MRSLRLSATVLTLLGALILSACGGASTAAPTAVPSAPTNALAEPTAAPAPTTSVPAEPTTSVPTTQDQANTLRWSLEGISDLTSIDPAKPGDAPTITVINTIFAGLVRLDEQLKVQPDGASSWKVSADGTSYTFTIRDGLKFSDGTPVTAGDFAYSINRALSPETASYGAPFQLGHIVGAQDVIDGKTKEVTGVKAIDDRTLEITLDAPLAYFLAQLTYPYTYVVPRKLIESGPDWETRAYGTGPFTVKEWKRGQSVLLAANENYWRGKPGITNILMSFNKESETAFQLYQTGELDIMGSQQNPIPAAHVAEVQNLPDFKSAASLATRFIGFNNKKAPFDNTDIRRAFALATDRATLANQVLGGAVVPADRILPTGLVGTQLPIKPLAFDATAAKAALTKAGFADGKNLPPITLAYGQEGDNEIVAQALQALWEQNLGVKVTLQSYELATFSKNLDTTYYTPTQGLQFYLSIWGADYPDPQNFLSQQLHTDVPNNNGHFANIEFDKLVEQADRLGDQDKLDQRLQLYNQAEQIAIDQVGWLPLYYPKFQILLRPRVEGMVVTPNGLIVPDWTKVHLK
ncbi:MAG: peptide ABC transporter substrate-binding protein [Roseiflexaceae bacterium]|nr:peptide ABC transporter substrate-binding protein [Roseiflexaceae bacterium]